MMIIIIVIIIIIIIKIIIIIIGIAVLIALFTVTFSHLHDNVFERGCEAISGKSAKLPEIASRPRSNTSSCK